MRSSLGGTERFSNDKSISTGNGRSGRSGARERARDSSSSLAGRPGRGSSQRKKAAYLTLGPAQDIIFHHPAEEEEVQRVMVSVGPLPHYHVSPFYLHLRSLPPTTSGTSGNFLSLRMVISEYPTSTRRWTLVQREHEAELCHNGGMAILPLHLRASETRFGFGFLYSSAYLGRELPTLLPPTVFLYSRQSSGPLLHCQA